MKQNESESELVRRPLTALGNHTTPRRALSTGVTRAWSVARGALREPLVHFLVIGAILFCVNSIIGRSSAFGGGQNSIRVSAAKLRQLRETWSARWGSPPDAQQLQALIDDFVREEVLYREAIASGLDTDDTIIRRHLAQKVEFLAQGVVAAEEPTDAELQQFFQARQERYLDPPKVGFSHVYFNASRRGASAAQAVADETLARLRAKQTPTALASLGDAFMLQHEYPPQTYSEIRDLFGAEFATGVLDLQPQEWLGPVRSSYGLHLVRIDAVIPSRVPSLDEVRSRVRMDFIDERVRSAFDAYYQRLRTKYRIDVEQQAFSTR